MTSVEQESNLTSLDNSVLLKFAYSDFLIKFPWDYYITQTFRVPRKDSLRASTRVTRVLEQKFGLTRSFVAVEPHSTGDLHLHMLTRHVFESRVPIPGMWKYLFKAFGRCTVEEIEDSFAVTRYCAKYVTKEGFHYEFTGDKSAWVLDN